MFALSCFRSVLDLHHVRLLRTAFVRLRRSLHIFFIVIHFSISKHFCVAKMFGNGKMNDNEKYELRFLSKRNVQTKFLKQNIIHPLHL